MAEVREVVEMAVAATEEEEDGGAAAMAAAAWASAPMMTACCSSNSRAQIDVWANFDRASEPLVAALSGLAAGAIDASPTTLSHPRYRRRCLSRGLNNIICHPPPPHAGKTTRSPSPSARASSPDSLKSA